MLKNTTALAIGAALLMLTSACGGGGERPSATEISEALQGSESVIPVPDAAADCVAKVFHDSDLSDETLRAIVENDEDYEGSDEEEEILRGLTTTVAQECADAIAE